MNVPYFKPTIESDEIKEVVNSLYSGWLTTGPKVKQFEKDFAEAVKAKHSIAVNSCTAALHLALDAMNLKPNQGVLVPTMTFAATAEVIRYFGAKPILVDCDPLFFHIDLLHAQEQIREHASLCEVVGIIPVHYAGLMVDMDLVEKFSTKNGLWVIEDAAHAFPSAYRKTNKSPWIQCGENTSEITCFSFYANKTITTGEGGMAVTLRQKFADKIRMMSLHGLSSQAWNRHDTNAPWDYKILHPGFKYNLTDIAASIGIHQLKKSEQLRIARRNLARLYQDKINKSILKDFIKILPACVEQKNFKSSHHLFVIKLNLENLNIDRNEVIKGLSEKKIGTSVHWRPLHLHPLYEDKTGQFKQMNCEWEKIISLPIYPGMCEKSVELVCVCLENILLANRKLKIKSHTVQF